MTAPDPRVAEEPTYPDVDLRVTVQRRQSGRACGPIVAGPGSAFPGVSFAEASWM